MNKFEFEHPFAVGQIVCSEELGIKKAVVTGVNAKFDSVGYALGMSVRVLESCDDHRSVGSEPYITASGITRFKPWEEPKKLYSGKVVCIGIEGKDYHRSFTVGKIYEFVDGRLSTAQLNHDWHASHIPTGRTRLSSFDDVVDYFTRGKDKHGKAGYSYDATIRFIEVVE